MYIDAMHAVTICADLSEGFVPSEWKLGLERGKDASTASQ